MTCGRFTLLTKFCVIATDHSRLSTQCHHPMGTKTTSPAETTHSRGGTVRPGAWHSLKTKKWRVRGRFDNINKGIQSFVLQRPFLQYLSTVVRRYALRRVWHGCQIYFSYVMNACPSEILTIKGPIRRRIKTRCSTYAIIFSQFIKPPHRIVVT